MYYDDKERKGYMDRKFDRKIVLEDGQEYYGYGFGANTEKVCEVVFNTSMVGYQEVVSDLSYTDQMVVMTYPLIGNYGIADDDFESKGTCLGALVVREYNDLPSNFRCTQTLSETMEEYGVPGIEGIDTRMLTKRIRDNGCPMGLICNADKPLAEAVEIIKNTPLAKDSVAKVSTKKKWHSRTVKHRFNVVVVDFGTRLSIIRTLNSIGCNVTVVPWNTSAEDILALKPDGVFLSDGPGNPDDVPTAVELVKVLRGKCPICGEGLGHQLIAIACGAKIEKLPFGHRGSNHPVKILSTGKIEIVSQNHGYTVTKESLEGCGLTVTHENVLDGTVEGLECADCKMLSTQYHPEVEAVDGMSFFEKFIAYMSE